MRRNEAVHRALHQQACKFHAMMSELTAAADTLDGDDLLKAMDQVALKYA